jgi:hypothetical protein
MYKHVQGSFQIRVPISGQKMSLKLYVKKVFFYWLIPSILGQGLRKMRLETQEITCFKDIRSFIKPRRLLYSYSCQLTDLFSRRLLTDILYYF